MTKSDLISRVTDAESGTQPFRSLRHLPVAKQKPDVKYRYKTPRHGWHGGFLEYT
jgi:hypothetical protein